MEEKERRQKQILIDNGNQMNQGQGINLKNQNENYCPEEMKKHTSMLSMQNIKNKQCDNLIKL